MLSICFEKNATGPLRPKGAPRGGRGYNLVPRTWRTTFSKGFINVGVNASGHRSETRSTPSSQSLGTFAGRSSTLLVPGCSSTPPVGISSTVGARGCNNNIFHSSPVTRGSAAPPPLPPQWRPTGPPFHSEQCFFLFRFQFQFRFRFGFGSTQVSRCDQPRCGQSATEVRCQSVVKAL